MLSSGYKVVRLDYLSANNEKPSLGTNAVAVSNIFRVGAILNDNQVSLKIFRYQTWNVPCQIETRISQAFETSIQFQFGNGAVTQWNKLAGEINFMQMEMVEFAL